jgi:hypothetical protein
MGRVSKPLRVSAGKSTERVRFTRNGAKRSASAVRGTLSKGLEMGSFARALTLPLCVAALVLSATAADAQNLVNGTFETRAPGPGSSGTPSGSCTTGEAANRFAPAPWSKQSTPDYHTQSRIAFDTIFRDRTSLPGFKCIVVQAQQRH